MVVTSEPAKAATGSNWCCMKRRLSPSWLSVNTIAAAAANAPPEETPTSAGSARGLRNRPCMIAPDAASSPPTIAAAAIRGIRIDHTHELVARQQRVGRAVRPQPERGRKPRQRNAGGAHRQRDQRGARERGQQAEEGE